MNNLCLWILDFALVCKLCVLVGIFDVSSGWTADDGGLGTDIVGLIAVGTSFDAELRLIWVGRPIILEETKNNSNANLRWKDSKI